MLLRLPFYCDIDQTLLMHDLDRYKSLRKLTVTVGGREFTGAVNQFNVDLTIKMWKLGRDVYFWSGTGGTYARAVAEALDIAKYACHDKAFQCKPIDYYLDDKDASEWIGRRIWLDPLTGEEE